MKEFKTSFCVLVLSTIHPDYKIFEDSIRLTYGKKLTENNVKYFFYKGGAKKSNIINDVINLNCNDQLSDTFLKFKMATELLLRNYPGVKLIFRTNLSSYLDVNNLIKYIKINNLGLDSYDGISGSANKISEYFYGNRIFHLLFKKLNFGSSINFYSGSGFFLGINNFNKLKERKQYFIDDVEIGFQLRPVKKASKYSRILIDNNFRPLKESKYKFMLNNHLFHYKFKTSNRALDAKLLLSFDELDFRNKIIIE